MMLNSNFLHFRISLQWHTSHNNQLDIPVSDIVRDEEAMESGIVLPVLVLSAGIVGVVSYGPV